MHIFVNNIINNKYFVTLNLESIKQHFDECNHYVLNLNID